MTFFFGAVLTQLPNAETELLKVWLTANGFLVREVNSKNWKDLNDGIRIFTKPSPELAKELLEWSIEPLLYGNFSNSELEDYKTVGVSLFWNKPKSEITKLPLSPLGPTNSQWTILTKNKLLDKQLSLFLKLMGQTVHVEGNLEHSIKRIQTHPIHFFIVNWDELDLKTVVPVLKKLKNERRFLCIGIKDFLKDNLYRDLKTGITEISEVLVNQSEILNVILHSFPMDPNQKTYPNQSVPVKKLGFTFQERKVPISI
ncbi:hypothetical protein P3G55_14680, partial [Leptospira sp. 96542]|nr:hypothetical protein [Leptospira sp. 96542]